MLQFANINGKSHLVRLNSADGTRRLVLLNFNFQYLPRSYQSFIKGLKPLILHRVRTKFCPSEECFCIKCLTSMHMVPSWNESQRRKLCDAFFCQKWKHYYLNYTLVQYHNPHCSTPLLRPRRCYMKFTIRKILLQTQLSQNFITSYLIKIHLSITKVWGG